MKVIGAPRGDQRANHGVHRREPRRQILGQAGRGEEPEAEDVHDAQVLMDLDAQKAELAQKYAKYQEAAVRLADLRAAERAATKRRKVEEDQLWMLEQKIVVKDEVVKDEDDDDDWRPVVDCPVPDPRVERMMGIAGSIRQQGYDRKIPEGGDRIRVRMKQAESQLLAEEALAEEAARDSNAAAPRRRQPRELTSPSDATVGTPVGNIHGDGAARVAAAVGGKGSDPSGSNLAGGKGGDNKKGKPIKRGGWMTKALALAKAVLDERLVEAKALAECYTFQAKAMETNIEEAGYEVCGTEGHEFS